MGVYQRFPLVLRCLIGVGSLLGWVGISHAQTVYYVSPQGDDGNDGLAPSSAFATIQAAADIVTSGDRVSVASGSYAGFMLDNKSGTASARIVFHAEPGVIVQGEGNQTCQRHETVCLWESNYVTLEGFEIVGRDCGYGQCDVLSARADGGQQHATQGVIIRDNVLRGGESRGLYITFPKDCVIQNNDISNSGIGIYFANGAPASYGDENSEIVGNYIHDNASLALHVNADASSPGDGIIRGLTVRRNRVLHNAGQAIHFDGVCDSIVVNNLVVGNRRGIIISRVDGAIAPENDVVANNTVIQESGSQVCLRVGGGAHDLTVFNNVFIHADSMVMDLEDNGGALHSDWNAVSNLSQVQNATGGDSDTIEVTLATAGFVDAAGDDFSLTASSPLVDAGIDVWAGVSAPGDDIAGAARPADGGYDIGAYEYGSASLVVLTDALPSGVLATAYSASLDAAGGTPPYQWSVLSGDLPSGIALEPSSGLLSGTPDQTGQFEFTVQVEDSASPSATALKVLSIGILAAEPDAGLVADAGGDAGGIPADGSPSESESGGEGCGCSAGTPSGRLPAWPLLLAAFLWLRRRSRAANGGPGLLDPGAQEPQAP